MIVCTCIVCGYTWKYKNEIDEDIIRASCAPCGHQGCFTVEKNNENKGSKDETNNRD